MSNNGELNNLYSELERAEKELSRAKEDWYSCTLNTPGRCAREADRVSQAENRVARVKAQIRMLEYEAVEP